MLYLSRSRRHSASVNAVFPEPTGLMEAVKVSEPAGKSRRTVERRSSYSRIHFDRSNTIIRTGVVKEKMTWNIERNSAHPPIPIVNARSLKFRWLKSGKSRSANLPACSRCSWVWPCARASNTASAACGCECEWWSCRWEWSCGV
jgi:hypothetical protein